ncbi:glycosyltransferase [Zongyangia hominis]|uniref:Glycosyltransferase n=1 Tax=Zongyangia hominis TaxID=2763677 RepID=A0A926ECK8_9FIRM|nr:glycosyltransferase [Zongyangia hominis]MBC8569471.1 glycosyltransferase [Zongyangia hominis]
MKIALIAPANSIHTVKWANAFVSRGHKVRLYSLPSHANQHEIIDERVQIVYLKTGGFKGYLLGGGELRRDIGRFAPDVVNAHYASGYGTLARMAKVHPLLLSVWGSDVYDFPLKSPLHKAMIWKNIQNSDQLASTSHVMAAQVKKLYPQYRKEIAVTPFGVDTARFSKREVEKECFTVGTVKLLKEKYGLTYLVRGFADFVKKLPEGERAQLLLYGGGEQEGELRELIHTLGLDGMATLCGAIPNMEVPQAISGMDVFCVPSVLNSESFGVSAVEAMACEVPVIASDVDGFTETVEDGVTGFLVPRRDAGAIAERLWQLYTDWELRQKMSRAGRERVERLYNWEDNVSTMETILKETAKLK